MKRLMFCILVSLAGLAVPAGAFAGELVVNGGFETGSFGSSWVHGAFRGGNTNPNLADHVVAPDMPYSGNYSALLGFKYTTQTTNAYAYMYQTVAIPAGVSRATLNFKIRMQGYDSDYYDPFHADIRSTGNTVLRRILNYAFSEWNDIYKDSGWLDDDNVLPVSHDVIAFAGQTVRVYFEQANLYDALYETWTYVDDVSLVYRMWVDLAVDGNGDDVFGALNSGNGGLSTRSALAGDTLSYALRIENEGTVTDTYRLTSTLPAGWTAWLVVGGTTQAFPYVMPALAPGASVTYTVKLRAPAGATAGSYDAVVNAQSTAQGSRVDSARLRAVISAATYAADLVIDGNGVGVIGDGGAGGFGLKTGSWGVPVTFALQLRNTGNAASTYAIAFNGDAGLATSVVYNGTTYTGSFTTLSIPAGTSAALTLQVQVASPNAGGDYDLYLTATSSADANKRDSIHAILRLLAPRVDMIIAANGNDVYGASGTGAGGGSSNAGERGAVVTFPITVQNESAVADSFTMSWTAPAAGWTATITINGVNRTFPTVTPTIAANSQAIYTLRIQIPGGAAYGTYQSILNAASRVAAVVTESVSATVSVATPSEVDILIDGQGADIYGPIGTGLGGTSVKTVSPGDTVVYQVEIQNVSGTNGFDVSWAGPAGWDVTFNGGYLPLNNIPAGTYPLRVIIPVGSTGGTFDVILDGRKTSKPFLLDSVTGRVVVIPPAIVDGVIDGNGDGVFGAIGSGAGGASLQTTPAPATMNFTVELQNQGPSGDSYTVQWNAIPGWTAQLNGLPSPFNTGNIPAGGSRLYTLSVAVPAGASVAAYQYILNIQSQNHATSFESIAARVNVVGPPRPDFVIDGNGDGVFGLAGSGQGGTSTRGALPGGMYTSTLRLRNAGSYPDSFQVQWSLPLGWPVGSVTIADSLVTHAATFWSRRLDPGASVTYTVTVSVPVSANGTHTTLINAVSSLPPSLSESVALVTETRALVRGTVFDDRDHNGVFGTGDVGLSGVLIRESRSGLATSTLADGSYSLLVPADSLVVVEQNPVGFVSLTPDTVFAAALAAGDTAVADFADVGIMTLTAGGVAPGAVGGTVDFSHRVQAGTAGHMDITANSDSAFTSVWYVDVNGNGLLDAPDRTLVASDGDLDPDGPGAGVLNLILRVFVPAAAVPGSTIPFAIVATQTVTGTPLVLTATTTDAVVVTPGAGQLSIQKSHDRTDARPGDAITYTIRLFNAGVDSLGNVALIDPVSQWVDVEADAFGAGLDLRWEPPAGAPVFFTFDPGDADEAAFTTADHTLRVIFSKNTAFYLAPGQAGVITYRVRVR
ncbi:MAG: NEW3 domain-containing protein [Candidatus Krumholzibacteria bacterium]|nr:NEW3 domain-containing protein [Candidatus Krumholzibacteria bacterium]MDH5271146.1 NEW3 domain-containing protein [Candidatus Krumholzibacteria bacterium]